MKTLNFEPEYTMKIDGILETCLYARDLEASEAFYRALPGLQFISKEKERHVFFRCGDSMLLIFNPAHTANNQTDMQGEKIPLHGATGEGHVAFAINPDELHLWKEYLIKQSIEIESEVTWPTGSTSVYFRDPAGNSLELVSPDIWDVS
ncbi:MAG: VOC family protein [Balneolaceae bacterium]